MAALTAKHKAEEAARERAEAAKHPPDSKPAIGHKDRAEEEERVQRNVSFFWGVRCMVRLSICDLSCDYCTTYGPFIGL